MRLLLDTHAFLWFVSGDPRLAKKAKTVCQAADAELFVSVVSVWEMAIKSSLGRLEFGKPLNEYMVEKISDGFGILSVELEEAAAVEKLPLYHRDPFDRLLAVQALQGDFAFVTGDEAFEKYGVKTIW